MTTYRITPAGVRRRAGQNIRAVGVAGHAYTRIAAAQEVQIVVEATARLSLRTSINPAPAWVGVRAEPVQLSLRSPINSAPAWIGVEATASLSTPGAWAVIPVEATATGVFARARISESAPAHIAVTATVGLTARNPASLAPAVVGVAATAGLRGLAHVRAVAGDIVVVAVAGLRNNTGGSWRSRWLDVYAKRQIVLNAIDANNRYLAKDAQLKSIANADAIVQTNARVTQVDGRVMAEANRTTLLTAEVNKKASAQALQSLSATVTQQGNTINQHGSLIQGVRSELNGKASTQALQALDTRVTDQGDQITAVSQSVTTVSAKARQADNKAELAASATQSMRAEVDTLTGRMDASYNLAVDAGGRVAGMRLGSNGAVSRIDFVGDSVRFIPPTGAPSGIEFDPGAGLIRKFGPGFQEIESATPFGPDGLVEYFGPNVGITNASKALARIWKDASGNAYFGGSLTSATLKNGGTSTQISGAASIETGPFGTNGRPKTVICAFSYDNGGTTQVDMSAHQLSARLILERQRGTHGAWEQVQAVDLAGTAKSEYEPGFPWLTSMSIGGGFTYTDSSPGTDEFNYRLRIENARGWPYWIGQGNHARRGTQSLSVLSIEEP